MKRQLSTALGLVSRLFFFLFITQNPLRDFFKIFITLTILHLENVESFSYSKS